MANRAMDRYYRFESVAPRWSLLFRAPACCRGFQVERRSLKPGETRVALRRKWRD